MGWLYVLRAVGGKLAVWQWPWMLFPVAPCRPNDVLWKRSHNESVLLHCVLWPLVSLLVGTLIVLLTICARSLAVRAEALQKRKFS
ncbi:hypothetical protein AGOR_G00246890 [Albula goreensis]|uniref:Uncharacterized protein n=1 Tax=Albula goreensis TaxID=1534307 RepID=A0A8T3CAU0_9TELE|nr:hypothetical protein AGOR_G00246890 [Albula goreensis]